MNKISLKLKITLWYTLAIVILSFITLTIISNIGHKVLDKDMNKELMMAVDSFERIMIDKHFHNAPIPEHLLYDKGVQIAVYDKDGNIVVGRNPFGIDNYTFEENQFPKEIDYDSSKYYIYDKKINTRDNSFLWIRGVSSITDKKNTFTHTNFYNLSLFFILILISSIGGYLLIDKALKPVEKIRSTAKKISESSDLSKRIDIGKGNDEIHTLANTFNDMLEKVEDSFNKEKQFTSDASHELRTPIAVILSQCEYAEECVEDISEMKEVVSSIKEQTNKMSKLVSDLLMISRMDNDKVNLQFEETNISELLEFVCEEQIEINNPNITLTQEIEQNIVANVDRLLMIRLFVNLISNAYQYNKENGEILVSLKKENEKIIFSVKDNGIGIKEENLSKIWDRFYQVDPSRNTCENSSSGLGLPMVKWIANVHKGELVVETKENEGSTFSFIL